MLNLCKKMADNIVCDSTAVSAQAGDLLYYIRQ